MGTVMMPSMIKSPTRFSPIGKSETYRLTSPARKTVNTVQAIVGRLWQFSEIVNDASIESDYTVCKKPLNMGPIALAV